MHAVVILNCGAGSVNGDCGSIDPDALREAFARAGLELTVQMTPPAELENALQTAIGQRPEAIIVGGGDGTISTAASHLVNTGIALGVLPLGTLNHFARDLGIPMKWEDAVVTLATGRPRAVDVGEVNGRVFINNCSIGSYPEAVRTRDRIRRERGRGKWVAMAIASFRVLRRLRRFRVRIETSDTAATLRTPFVFIGNNRYTGHLLRQSLRPRLDENLLSIYTTRAKRRFTLLRLAWHTLTRSVDDVAGLEIQCATEATISSVNGDRLPVAMDGELVQLTPPLRLRVRPGALHVLAPSAVTNPASAAVATARG